MKNSIKLLILIASILYFTACCMFKTRFSEEDLKWLNPYKEGDTLIFRSAKGDMDTSWIVQKVIYYPACNPIEVNAKYKFHTGRIFYQNRRINYSSGGKELISIVKYGDKTSIDIFYLSAGFMLDSPEMMELYKNILDVTRIESEKVYIFSNYHPKSKPEDIEFLYWHDDYGIIKYITHSGLEWKRINLGFEAE